MTLRGAWSRGWYRRKPKQSLRSCAVLLPSRIIGVGGASCPSPFSTRWPQASWIIRDWEACRGLGLPLLWVMYCMRRWRLRARAASRSEVEPRAGHQGWGCRLPFPSHDPEAKAWAWGLCASSSSVGRRGSRSLPGAPRCWTKVAESIHASWVDRKCPVSSRLPLR